MAQQSAMGFVDTTFARPVSLCFSLRSSGKAVWSLM